MSVDSGGVGPVRFHRHDVEAASRDEIPRDGGAGAVEFAGAMARFAQQDHFAAGETVDRRPKAASSGSPLTASEVRLMPGAAASLLDRAGQRQRNRNDVIADSQREILPKGMSAACRPTSLALPGAMAGLDD